MNSSFSLLQKLPVIVRTHQKEVSWDWEPEFKINSIAWGKEEDRFKFKSQVDKATKKIQFLECKRIMER